MSDAINKCSAQETAACCCVHVGTVMDNTDCTASYSQIFSSEQEAQQTLAALTEKARSVESDPCAIDSSLQPAAGGRRRAAER